MTHFTPRSGEGGWGAARADLIHGWLVSHLRGLPADLFAAGMGDASARAIRWCEPERAAVVLGSAQVDAPNPHGWEVVRRRTGGSAVYLEPGRLVWADVILPHDDPLWSDDVRMASNWLGGVWAGALSDLGVDGVTIHAGAMVKTAWSARVCFAGIAPGEVEARGRKVVGISQRRTRQGALFQCAALLRWDPPEPDLADVAVGIAQVLDRVVDASEVEAAFMARLGSVGRRG